MDGFRLTLQPRSLDAAPPLEPQEPRYDREALINRTEAIDQPHPGEPPGLKMVRAHGIRHPSGKT
jgi:hypothetical protein